MNVTVDLPPVKPSAIALGTIFTHTASLAILAPVFGDTYNRAQRANSSEEFIKSKEAASAASAWGSSLVGSAVQTYGVGALINATGTLTYKGAAYLGSLIFMASSAPSVSTDISIHLSNFVSKVLYINIVVPVHLANLHGATSSRHCCRRSRRPHVRDRGPELVPHLVGHSHERVRLKGSGSVVRPRQGMSMEESSSSGVRRGW